MSIVPKETVEVIAQSTGINNLTPDAALALAPDVEYRMREIMQEAIKCMHHSKRTTLTTDAVNSALKLRNVEPIYGFASGDPLRFRRALGHKDLFYIDDKDLDLKDVIEAPLPKAPLDNLIVCHWLAIEGVQPGSPLFQKMLQWKLLLLLWRQIELSKKIMNYLLALSYLLNMFCPESFSYTSIKLPSSH